MDRVRVQVNGGNGGKGVVAFEQLQGAKRKAAGGSGGRGGNVVIRAVSSLDDLSFSTFVFNGGHGRDAQGSNKGGGRGRDTIVHVPVGTTVKEVHRVRDVLV